MTELSYFHSSSHLPPVRLINAIVVFNRVADRYGIRPEVLLKGSGIHPEDLNDPQKLINTTQERTVALNFIKHIPVPWIGLEMGQNYHFSANGKLGMAMMCCETMMDALKLILNYIHLTASYHQYSIRIKGKTGYAKFKELVDLGEVRRFVCEGEMASIHKMASLSYEDVNIFKEMHFAYPVPSYAKRYNEIFGCPVIFNAPEHRVIFDAQHLFNPLKLANPLLKTGLEKDCREMAARMQDHETLTERIRQEILHQQDSPPTLDQLARRINISPRTIRRKLMKEKTTYKTILTNIRKDKAVDLLLTTRMPMEKIAIHLGFNEVSSFYRAFKNWTGMTPSKYREKRFGSPPGVS